MKQSKRGDYAKFLPSISSLSDSDLELRRSAIGSSEAAAVIGVNPFMGKHGLWLLKTGRVSPEVTEQMTIGSCFEPAILSVYAVKTGYSLEIPPTVRHHKFTYIVDSADALAYSGNSENPVCAVEVKRPTVFGYSKYGEPGTDQVPIYYIVQGMFHMAVHGVDTCEFPVDFGYGGIHIYRSHFDKELFLGIAYECERFIIDYVNADIEPPADGSSVATRWLRERYRHTCGEIIAADAEAEEAIAKYAELKAQEKALELEKTAAKQVIMGKIGNNYGVVSKSGIKHTWAVNKNGVRAFR